MTLKEIREAYEGGSGSANSINRQLVFSGIAIVWILKGGQDTTMTGIPEPLLWALGLLALSLFFDIIQSLVHTAIWYRKYSEFKDEALQSAKDGLDEESIIVKEKESWSIATWCIWLLKILITLAAYAFIAFYLAKPLFG